MSEKRIISVSVVLTLALMLASVAQAADPSLVGWWKLDEGSGTTTVDSSGRGNHGTLEGDADWAAGNFGNGVYIEGSSWVEIPPAAWDPIERQVTISFWAYGGDAQPVNHFVFAAYSADDNAARQASAHIPWGNGNVYWDTGYDGAYDRLSTALPAEFHKGAWVHWTFTKDADSGEQKIYINGELFLEGGGYTRPMTGVNVFVLGCRGTGGRDQNYVGTLDDFRLYDRILDEEEIAIVMSGAGAGFPLAMRPEPEDGAMLEATWANLSWSPGSFAVSHDLYFGTSFDDVNDGAEGTLVGNLATTSQVVGFAGFPAPDGLVPGTTYYWRINEVNDANVASPWKGDVWSFWIPPKTAYNNSPADGITYVLQDVTLNWTAGFGAKMHNVYFGDNFDDVNNAVGAPPQTDTTFTPGTLELDKTYYWRVDEFDPPATHKGDVWSFTTVPDVAVTNPNLMLWWTLDEGQGATAVDWSGHGNHGAITGDAQWTDGYQGTALTFGADVYVEAAGYDGVTGTAARTCCAWIRTTTANRNIMSWGQNSAGQKWRMRADGTGGLRAEVNGGYHYGITNIADGRWHHVAVTFEDDGSPDALDTLLYVDGRLDATSASLDEPIDTAAGPVRIGESPWHNAPFLDQIDDARIYDKVLTAEEIQQVMLGNTKLAGSPVPDRVALVDIRDISSLSWSAGDTAASHDVYFGTDQDAVAGADNSAPEFQGNQAGTSLSLADLVEFGGGDYYWRIDEVEADGTVIAGTIWKFTVPDYLIVEDFESYNDLEEDQEGSNRIYLAWIDGYGTTTNGSQAGNLDPPFMSQGRESAQAMPLSYNNAGKTSEATRTLVSKKDWTVEGVTKLVIWFSGDSGNAADRMFVALGNAIVYHPDDAATQDGGWNEWVIDLQEFANQGTDLTNVGSITLGFGTRGAPVPAGGTGTVHFDDIVLIRPTTE
ncbi:MAG: hypothetical protein CEE38_05495 [Planctomycetes bacterium B3_Pla]|nr:MAG: hypothetical protein CEE38_05495 [Planctomycetes bacterium B3_Pla]